MPNKNMIFVFGSNLSGIHGAGAAAYAHRMRGAQMGVGEGITGQSYALPTKGLNISFMPLDEVVKHVRFFLDYAELFPNIPYQVTCVGCGLAGFKNSEIAPLFKNAPDNCHFDTKWYKYLGDNKSYWGTF
jgi:hypothetical protein